MNKKKKKLKGDNKMGIYETITLRSYKFDTIIELLEDACEKSRNFEEIETYVGLISCIEDERREYWREEERKYEKQRKWENTLSSFSRFMVEEKGFNQEEINKIISEFYQKQGEEILGIE